MKKEESYISRRRFTQLSGMGIATIPMMGFIPVPIGGKAVGSSAIEVNLFSKHLQFLNYNDMADAAAEMGFDGLDLTVREKGHVLPTRVEDDLPKAVEAMRSHRLKPNMMTTDLLDTKDTTGLKVLETAAKFGLTHYRMGWLSYPEKRPITESQSIYSEQFRSLESINEKLGLIGCYQNHAGNFVGSSIWDLAMLLSDTENKFIGCQYDIRHAVVEGGLNWELGLRRIGPYIKSIVIKDFKWGTVQGKWKPINTPLGMGMVNFEQYFSLLKRYRINVPISLHLEYDLGGAEHGASKIQMHPKEVFKKMKADLDFLKNTWDKIN
ncbi:sugar phosphate isomerase/epimerase [Flagellimonas taeanensis]|uniref:sugar phosphate isomerase/epimerase family protein n=1 Tax=Flavobacteriaceae TaxID=49546 RepID=UPI000E68C558|nr:MULTISPECIES: sugar phosphate isomerase/epimerase family protein [Allomuricauda]MDC6386612.1 sugar phosphate isomerase/epimerase [Muricauda sp. SK9]RIV51327.1 sugar phosphate isomerase/epimerase [Allomuricauda taeanensis]